MARRRRKDLSRKSGDVSVEDLSRKSGDVSVDRFSDLPEELICHVLSFLPTIAAVKTTLLSPKFLNLWKNITTLRFSDHGCGHIDNYEPGLLFSDHGCGHVDKFVESVWKVFSALETETRCIDEFYIETYCFDSPRRDDIRQSRLSSCVTAAVAKNVKRLVLLSEYGCWADRFQLPSCIFTCNSLEVLEVSSVSLEINPSWLVCLPNLKILRWVNVRVVGDVSFDRLISGCSSLHSLYLEPDIDGKEIDGIEVHANLEICSPTLEHLTIISPHAELFDHRLKIDTPALKYLHLGHIMFTNMSIKTSSSLIKANISLGDARFDFRTISKFIGALSNVKFLTLDASIQWLEPSGDSIVWPIFPNLTSLTLHICSDKFDTVKDLLHKSPTLETLRLVYTYSSGCNNLEESNIQRVQDEMLEFIELNASCWKKEHFMTRRKSRRRSKRLGRERLLLVELNLRTVYGQI